MTDPNNERHPSTLSDEERAALQASDPSAYDDDTGDSASGDGEGAGEAGSEAGGESAGGEGAAADEGKTEGSASGTDASAAAGGAAQGAADADAGADAADGKAAGGADGNGGAALPPVPAPRFAEVVAQRNNAERLAAQQAAELARLRDLLAATKPPKDFDAEFDGILKQYDEGEIDQAEYERRKRVLQREEHEHISSVQAMKAQAAGAEAAVERSWKEDVAAWTQANPGFLDKAGNAELFQRALNAASAFHGPNVSNTKLLEEASKMAFAEAGYTPPSAKSEHVAGDATTGDPAAGRRAQNAKRAAEAAGAPPAIDGGVGGRGGPERGIDLENLKPGTFSAKLSKAEQEKLLGEGAV